jgi:DNA-binding NtrC family response regulator
MTARFQGVVDVAEGHVLLIDDNDLFRTALAESLRYDGHRVLDFAAPLDPSVLAALPPLQAVITDCWPPDRGGLAFLRTVHAIQPDVPIVLVTAFPPHDLSVTGVPPACLQLLLKPVRYEDVCAALRPRPRSRCRSKPTP